MTPIGEGQSQLIIQLALQGASQQVYFQNSAVQLPVDAA